jgi:truncated hemoglobin YjbI
VQEQLHSRGEGWLSVSVVDGEPLLRCVLANPELTAEHCDELLAQLEAAAAKVVADAAEAPDEADAITGRTTAG